MNRFLQTAFFGALWLVTSLLLPENVHAQTAASPTVSGTVVDANKQPLAGVTVIIRETTRGTVTDKNGKYSIRAGKNDVLEFSLLGYTPQTAKVGTQTRIDVSLAEDAKQIDAVVVGRHRQGG